MLRTGSETAGFPRVAAFGAALAMGLALASSGTTTAGAQQLPATATLGASAAADDLDAVFANQACTTAKEFSQLDAPIAHIAARINSHEPVRIVALGSSSTAGARASSPAFSYPSRLGRELNRRFPKESFSVINDGVNGEEAADMIARLDTALASKPDLVIWQVGTNAVLHDKNTDEIGQLLQSGIDKIKSSGADVMLIDPQFAPQVNAKPTTSKVVELIGWVAKRTNVPLFRRYSTMQNWHDVQAISFDRFINADGIHMNDWGYSCLARLLANNIATTIERSRAVADVKPQIQ